MFATKVPAIPYSVHHTIVRYLRGAVTVPLKLVRKNTPLPKKLENQRIKEFAQSNPGIGSFIHEKNRREGKIDPDWGMDDIYDLEASSENLQYAYEKEFNNVLRNETRKQFHNIKRKHFKPPKFPNMVPYLDKQAMKILYERDPDEWNTDKLAESFPVTPAIAMKIIKSPFTAYTVEQVRRHDKIVKRNWQLFKEGTLEIDDEMKSHYAKFTDRVNFETEDEVIEQYLPPPVNFDLPLKKKEFGSLIENYEHKKNRNQDIRNGRLKLNSAQNQLTLEAPETKMRMISEDDRRHMNRKSLTLSAFREQIKKDDEQIDELSRLIVSMEKKTELPTSSSSSSSLKPKKRNADEEIVDYLDDVGVVCKAYENSLNNRVEYIPMRIEIPKGKQKTNQIYQVEDRFYDNQGYFLYRVPGLF